MHEGSIRRFYPIGAREVRRKPPAGRVELPRAETAVPHEQRDGVVEFVNPRIRDYEVAALLTARPD
jgi:hypothetical protein